MPPEPTFSTDQMKAVGVRRIPTNLWDDYLEDGFVPPGKTQETRA